MHDRNLSRRTLLTASALTASALAGARPATASSRPDRLRRIVAGMSPEEKIGQLFVMRVYGHSATDPDPADAEANLARFGVRTAAEVVERFHLGGIIYFAWANNTRDPLQIARLSNGIQRAGLAGRSRLPLLIATDQEHGIVARIGRPATLLPGAMALGAGGSRTDARRAAGIAAAELAAMGITQNYAPVADVNVDPGNPVIGVRSFGADPRAAARMVAAQVSGHRRTGVAATAKHFPGHGDTTVDSHTGIPVITHTREEWGALDAPPFRAAIAAGIDAVMTAHIQFPALDPSNDPATLSHPILTGILRQELGFEGVVVTDALTMQGVREQYGDDRVPVLALLAGADQLLDPPDPAVAWRGVRDALESGELSTARIDESILRILRLKERLGLLRDPFVPEHAVEHRVGTRSHLAAADRIAEGTTTLLTNTGGLLPLGRRRTPRLLVVGADPASPTGTTGPPTGVLAAAFAEAGFAAAALPTGTSPTAARIEEAVAAAADRDVVVVGTYNVTAGSPQRTLVARLAATGVPVVALALRNPYDIAHLDGATAALAAYSWTDVELRAAVRVITGGVRPRGRLPVPVLRADDPGRILFPTGHGLSYGR
ncbi:glycoside hydrolase family 3 N-terminal domain-containing protein [Streptomyces sp. C10-9-1]|uniref:glycoside hydrolase family 3 protein n=1 Tax=Streptomyces sp. C10-9-1 TaxID=1859285 RepID=UPI003F4A3838